MTTPPPPHPWQLTAGTEADAAARVPDAAARAHAEAEAGGETEAAAEDADLGEELCRVQANILDMGADNYERLRRVCPDTNRRYRALQHRVGHQVRLALAAAAPRWRTAPQRLVAAAATASATRELWAELDERGGTAHLTHTAVREAATDEFSPGPPRDAERCWRCDARDAASDIGLCEPCPESLASR
jgi:hypothetical protein